MQPSINQTQPTVSKMVATIAKTLVGGVSKGSGTNGDAGSAGDCASAGIATGSAGVTGTGFS